ncbi:MAG: hypothetical protein JWN01_982 [Patescibacteria group bacterium]|nr:hypothetical protein [Patescibacteria group bacterium]
MRLPAKLILIICGMGLITTIVAPIVVYVAVSGTLKSTISANQQATASTTLGKIDRFISERMDELGNVGRAQQFTALLASPDGTNPQLVETDLHSVAQLAQDWNNLTLLDLHGKAVAVTTESDRNKTLATLESSFAGLYNRALTGQTVYSDVLRSNEDGPTLAIMTPITDRTGQPVGVLVGEINWSAVLSILHEQGNATTLLLNHSGLEIGSNQADTQNRILTADRHASPIFQQASHGGTGTIEAANPDNPEVATLASYTSEIGSRSYKGNGWHLLLLQPTSIAFAPAKNLALALLAGLLVASLVVCLIMFWVAHRLITLPIRRLSTAIQNISLGNLAERLEVTSHDELGQLATTFNTVTTQLAATTVNLQQEKSRLESSINSLPLGFMLTDAAGDIITLNPIMNTLLNLKNKPPKFTKGKHQTANIAFLQQLLDHCQTTLAKRQAFHIPEQSYDNRIFRLFFSPVIQNDTAIGVAVLVEDITEAKLLDRSKDEFFSIASHELRTPLTAIRGNTSMIQQYYGEKLKDQDLKELVGDIHESSLRLITIVNDFLDASRLEQGKMKLTLEQFDLKPVIESVIYELGALSHEKKIYIRTDNTLGTLPLVYADKNRVKQIIYNLTGNAMRFTEKGGITIKPEVQGDQLKVYVTDTGDGMSPENQQLLFHKFQQASDNILTRDTTRGTGLGLYICRLLLDNMNGKIKLESSEVGKGTTFSFTLPLNPPKSIKAPQAPKS